jgi:dynein heavy chain
MAPPVVENASERSPSPPREDGGGPEEQATSPSPFRDVVNGAKSSVSSVQHPAAPKSPVVRLSKQGSSISSALASTRHIERHIPVEDIVEPKCFLSHETREGQVPRRIVVERMKKEFSQFDIRAQLEKDDFITYFKDIELRKFLGKPPRSHLDAIPFKYFDDSTYEYATMEMWLDLLDKSTPTGLKARAMKMSIDPEKIDSKKVSLLWKSCYVTGYDAEEEYFTVVFDNNNDAGIVKLHRVFICFSAEDPVNFCARLKSIMLTRQKVHETFALNLYVDNMPMDNIKSLDSEQVNRIVKNALSVRPLAADSSIDTSADLQQCNTNHIRTLNKLIFVGIISSRVKEIASVSTISVDTSLFPVPRPMSIDLIQVPYDVSFSERMRQFMFNSLWNKVEVIAIVRHIQSEICNLDTASFYAIPEKTIRVEEFSVVQSGSCVSLSQFLRETWTHTIVNSIRSNLKDVQKGWFNFDESNLEVYNFSKLKKFLYRVNFMMEDTIRNLVMRCTKDYVSAILSHCPTSVEVIANNKVEVVGDINPLFVVDLKFVDATSDEGAHFIYSSKPSTMFDEVLKPFDQAFELLKGMVKVERKVMRKLFWSYDPIIRIPYAAEEWAGELSLSLKGALKSAILTPMAAYLGT